MAIRNVPANETVIDKEEPGAVDNRISWIPSDWPETEGWQDGEEYPFMLGTAKGKVRQISPGEGEMIPDAATRQEAAEEEAAPAPRRGRYSNPAVAAMADEV